MNHDPLEAVTDLICPIIRYLLNRFSRGETRNIVITTLKLKELIISII